MEIRAGTWVLSINALFLATACAYFLRMARAALLHRVLETRRDVNTALLLATVGGAVGALAYGNIHWLIAPPSDLGVQQPMWQHLSFGSFGAYWGVLAGLSVYAACGRRPVLPLLDAVLPSVLAGGAIARVADVVSGIPHTLWPLYDLLAQLVTLGLILAIVPARPNAPPGQRLLIFLAGYGLLRLLLELARGPANSLTTGQICALLQILVATILVLIPGAHSRTSVPPAARL